MAYAVAAVEASEIDATDILRATLRAMASAVRGLSVVPELVLVDGNVLPPLAVPARAVVRGDRLVPAISAASILAKVTRDATMDEWGFDFRCTDSPGIKGMERPPIWPRSFNTGRVRFIGRPLPASGSTSAVRAGRGASGDRGAPGTGEEGRDRARGFLERHGVRILLENFSCAAGEIDLIGREGDTLLFIEVKTRSSGAFGPPQLAVHLRKQKQIVRTAQWFLAERRIPEVACRFDVWP